VFSSVDLPLHSIRSLLFDSETLTEDNEGNEERIPRGRVLFYQSWRFSEPEHLFPAPGAEGSSRLNLDQPLATLIGLDWRRQIPMQENSDTTLL
jgi:hypothetical protein